MAHLGGGITVGANLRGRVVDCTHGLSEGPFAPELAVALPTPDLLDLALAGKSEPQQLRKRLPGQGRLGACLGTTDGRAVAWVVKEGRGKAGLIFEAMAYQTAKDIGAMSVVLKGRIDGITLIGGLAHSGVLTEKSLRSALRCLSMSPRRTVVRLTPLRFARRNLDFFRNRLVFDFLALRQACHLRVVAHFIDSRNCREIKTVVVNISQRQHRHDPGQWLCGRSSSPDEPWCHLLFAGPDLRPILIQCTGMHARSPF